MTKDEARASAAWVEQGQQLAERHRHTQFEIADWLVSGTALHPDSNDQSAVYDTAEQLFPDYTRETLRHFAVTARAFPACTRVHANLTFGHYRVAQSLPDGQAAEWLAKADREQWPVSRLRLAISDFEYERFHPGAGGVDPDPDAISEQKPTKPLARSKPKPKVPDDCIRTLPVPYRSQLKLRALARLYRISADALLARVIDSFLELHADDVAATERIEADREDADRRWLADQRAAYFQRVYGMAEQAWRSLTTEQQKALSAAAEERQRAIELAAKRAAKQAREEQLRALVAAQQEEQKAARKPAQQAAAHQTADKDRASA